MDKNEFKRLMDGYLQGKLSTEKRELLQRWYDSFGESEVGVPGMEDQEGMTALKEELYGRIHGAIQPKKMPLRKIAVFRWAAIAALFVLALGTMVWLYSHQNDKFGETSTHVVSAYHQIRTGIKQIKKVDLPDGSMLYVNANSTIRIREPLLANKREIFLDEGEAYFEVARDSLRPFIVHTPSLKMEVLGTAFNVKSYKTLDDVTIEVQHGKVRVSDSQRVLDELTAFKGLNYRKANGQTERIGLNNDEVNAWARGIVVLQKADFNELAQTLYNLYGVHLEHGEGRTANHHYNLTIHADRSLEETMAIICGIHNTKYRRKDNVVTIYP
ncbi:FecR domain-containing protein [Olivibacter sp. SA151]|uniref:FecR family protein n=1 Tax=Olivibacter jilunii TaxID=985016 RepID=UPI003F138ADD